MYSQKYQIVEDALASIGANLENKYDGFIVKKLKSSNTLDDGRTTKQTHIAITGEQMDIFPYVRATGYFDNSYATQDNELKKYFVLQIPAFLHKDNLIYLGGVCEKSEKKVYTSIVRSKRDGAADQVQMSIINLDTPDFISFRKLCHTNDYMIILKRKSQLIYDFYCIKATDVKEDLKSLNNHFFKESTNTVVKLDQVINSNTDDKDENINQNILEENNCFGYNKIYYGIPGCGKSFHIEDEVLKEVDKEHDVFRTTFYLDYSNSDFIGQIYPVVRDDGSVSYEEKPGPFTKALERALRNPNKMIYLVIEEINRGNAAAIFGDTFQLLDRLKKDRDGRVAGDSEYPVNNEFIEGYFKKNNVPFNSDKIYIPHNLTLLATMNTSDQNVFPLDTAFKRRWDREKIMTDWNEVDDIKNLYIPYTDVTWEKFATTINNKMLVDDGESDVSVSEDKQMGAYFVKENMLSQEKNAGDKDSLKAFISNVMDYLYNDVTKFNHGLLFDNSVKTYDGLYETMTECASVLNGNVDDSTVGVGKRLFESVLNKEIVDELFDQEVDDEQGTNN